MRPLVRDFLTGLTVLAGAAGLVVMLFIFGELAQATHRSYPLTVTLTTAGGLTDSSPVTLNGVRVGRVVSTAPTPTGASVSIAVRRGVDIPRNTRLAINQSFVGDASLEFTVDPGLPSAPGPYAPGDVVDGGAPATMWSQITGMIEAPLTRLTRTADRIDALADTYNVLGRQLVDLTAPRGLAEVDAGGEPNLRTVLARADIAMQGASAWLNDAELLVKTRTVLDRADQTLTQADALAKAWTAAAETVDQKAAHIARRADELGAGAVDTLTRIGAAADELRAALELARAPTGTVGQLLNNPDLYNSVNDAALRLDKTLTDFQLLIEKFRAEGVPLNF